MKTRFPAIVEMHSHIKQYSPETARRMRVLIATLHRPWAPITEYSTTVDEVVQVVADLYLESAETYNADLIFRFRREIYGAFDAYTLQRRCMLSASGVPTQ